MQKTLDTPHLAIDAQDSEVTLLAVSSIIPHNTDSHSVFGMSWIQAHFIPSSLFVSHLHCTLRSFAACFLPRGLLSLLLVWCWQFRSGGNTLDTWRRLRRLGRVDLSPQPPASEKGEEALVGLGVGNQDARQVYVLAHLVAHDLPRRQRVPGIYVPDPEQFWRKESHTGAIPQHGPKHGHAQHHENLLPEAV